MNSTAPSQQRYASFSYICFNLCSMKTDKFLHIYNRLSSKRLDGVMEAVMALRQKALEQQIWETSDLIRIELPKRGIRIKGKTEETTWT